MGIESDQVVYEYLSRVGDVAQQRQLPSATRMRLVAELRNEIDRRRARATVDSPAAVRRILARLGSPDDIVNAATGTTGATAAGPAPRETVTAVPVQPDRERADGAGRTKGLRRVVPRPRPAAPAVPEPSEVPSPPHRAGEHELADSATQADWWRVDSSPWGVGDNVPGFIGGVEIPELLKRPPKETDEEGGKAGADGAAPAGPADSDAAADAEEAAPDEAPRRRLPRLPAVGRSSPFLLLAAVLLVAGAVLGNWYALLLGWLLAYGSRRLTQTETKWAVMVLPGLSVTAGLVWLWGRTEGRWGDPIAEGRMGDAVAETWPWVVRGAAVASALFLVWRSQRKG
ncbi:hypothetical protein [Streptomyces sp. DH24]|uniref:hypothetical protein n=1 Tax=Streptomyces sp. DH24 TaxID=3040123 RepID=UPI002441AAA9|nr:hypothetical protein [Streptomyces sp. DH24]MDG9719245.1 hypothetical protein [Streptomyces sp. DH24]